VAQLDDIGKPILEKKPPPTHIAREEGRKDMKVFIRGLPVGKVSLV
jgi:hypothetical protein